MSGTKFGGLTVETMDTVDTMDNFLSDLCNLWTQWTEKYAVDISAVEWDARDRRFESSRPDQTQGLQVSNPFLFI